MSLQAIQRVQRLRKLRDQAINRKAARKTLSQLKLLQEDKAPSGDAEAEQETPVPPDLTPFWSPNPGQQSQFWYSNCHEILYGGAGGGGKSAAMTALPLKWSHLDGFLSLTLRRTFKQGKQLRKYASQLYRKAYPGLKAVKSDGYSWNFPSGAQAAYGHCENETDYDIYDGWEINLLCIDELTSFTKEQYLAISARVRTSNPKLPQLIRATSNPGGDGHEWVFERWGPWLNPEFQGLGLSERYDDDDNRLPPAHPGEVLWVTTDEHGVETYHRSDVPGSLSRTFIPANISDNPHLDAESYRAQLNQLDPVRREQLLNGNWLVKPAAGKYFNRTWVEFIDAPPPDLLWVRNWDLAGSEKKDGKVEPDWTASTKMARDGDFTIIGHASRIQASPGKVRAFITSTAEMDGEDTVIGIPQDPGQAGVDQVASYVTMLARFMVIAYTETGDKLVRFGPFSTQAEHKKVKIVRGPWNNEFITQLERFPSKDKDDWVDSTSGAYKRLTSGLITGGESEHVRSKRR